MEKSIVGLTCEIQGNELVITYEVPTETGNQTIRIRVEMPEIYEQLLHDKNFVNSTKALLMHFLSTLEFWNDKELFAEHLYKISELRDKLFKGTQEIIRKALNDYIAQTVSIVPKKKQLNNVVWSLINE